MANGRGHNTACFILLAVLFTLSSSPLIQPGPLVDSELCQSTHHVRLGQPSLPYLVHKSPANKLQISLYNFRKTQNSGSGMNLWSTTMLFKLLASSLIQYSRKKIANKSLKRHDEIGLDSSCSDRLRPHEGLRDLWP